MLRANHEAVEYATPSFTQPPAAVRLQEVLARLLKNAVKGSNDPLALSDSGDPTVDEFARRFEEVRDSLVERTLRGEKLPADEALVLELVNAALWATMVEPRPESERVRQAVEEGELLLQRLAHGQD